MTYNAQFDKPKEEEETKGKKGKKDKKAKADEKEAGGKDEQ